MSKHPHIYSFRLSDADEQKYRALLKRLHLDLRNENSGTFRLFIKNLSEFFRELDATAHSREDQGNTKALRAFTPVQEQREYGDHGEEPEPGEEPWWLAMCAEVRKNHAYLERLAISELNKEGLPLYAYLDSKMTELRKKLGINYSIHQYDWAEFKKEFERK